jgi:hypothetical protein
MLTLSPIILAALPHRNHAEAPARELLETQREILDSQKQMLDSQKQMLDSQNRLLLRVEEGIAVLKAGGPPPAKSDGPANAPSPEPDEPAAKR